MSIRNFRGIRELDWAVPDRALLCLIGRGDSTKTTVLEAVRRAFYPQWNLDFDDSDFHLCSPTNAIRVDVTVTALPEQLKDLASYGHWLCGWNPTAKVRTSEPGEGLEDALRIKMTVGADLEPSWRIIRNDDDEGVVFKATDRANAAVSLIGALSDRHLTWSRGSLLSRLTTADNLASALAEAGRAAKAAMEARRAQSLATFDAVASVAEVTARSLGVTVSHSYKAHLDADAISVQIGGLALHDGDMPLRQLGLGSKRMLTTGLQKQALQTPHITLFDEVEIGLEPHRIARLVEHLRADPTGQYFLTTHSPVVLRELSVDDLHIVHCRAGRTEVVAAAQPAIVDSIQGRIRSGAEAFLAPKIVVCEGATEAGFLRALDDHWISNGLRSFAYSGTAAFDAVGAGKVRQVAEDLRCLQYDVAVIVDSDEPTLFSDADAIALRAANVHVAMWDGDASIEERVFADVSWRAVLASFKIACDLLGDQDRRMDQVKTQYGQDFVADSAAWRDEPRMRAALGKAAKVGDWFKQQSRAQIWATAIGPDFDLVALADRDLFMKVNSLREWIHGA